MVSIRLQRTGRRRQAQFRVVVQDARRAPTSGRVIANLGFYNPHTKEHGVDLEKVALYLKNGAQPSMRVVRFLLDQKVDLPAWVSKPTQHLKKTKHPEKLRRNQSEEKAETKTEELQIEEPVDQKDEKESSKDPEDSPDAAADKNDEEPATENSEDEKVVEKETDVKKEEPASKENVVLESPAVEDGESEGKGDEKVDDDSDEVKNTEKEA